MKRYLLGTALTLCALVSTPATAAEVIFDFSGSGFFGGTLNGAGTLTTSDESFVNPDNGFTVQTITGITGTFNGSTITGLASGVFGANNLLYLTGPFFLDGKGLGFNTASGVAVNLFVTNDTSYRVNTQGAGLLTGLVTANATTVAAAVPEPSTWMLMLLGMAGVGFSMRRKSNQTLRVRYA